MPNLAFEADAVKQRTVSCWVRAPRGLNAALGLGGGAARQRVDVSHVRTAHLIAGGSTIGEGRRHA